MKRLIYKLLLKYPLIILLLKTPLKIFFIKYMRSYRKRHNILQKLLDYIFWQEYFSKLKNPEEMRKITNSTLDDGEGRKWAKHYYNKYIKRSENSVDQKKDLKTLMN